MLSTTRHDATHEVSALRSTEGGGWLRSALYGREAHSCHCTMLFTSSSTMIALSASAHARATQDRTGGRSLGWAVHVHAQCVQAVRVDWTGSTRHVRHPKLSHSTLHKLLTHGTHTPMQRSQAGTASETLRQRYTKARCAVEQQCSLQVAAPSQLDSPALHTVDLNGTPSQVRESSIAVWAATTSVEMVLMPTVDIRYWLLWMLSSCHGREAVIAGGIGQEDTNTDGRRVK